MLRIVLAAAVWGQGWHRRAVVYQCDNQAVVTMVKSGRCHEPQVVHLLWGLALFAWTLASMRKQCTSQGWIT